MFEVFDETVFLLSLVLIILNLLDTMKLKLYHIFLLIAIMALPAAGQGINRLWGLTPTGGNPGFGMMFSTDGAGRNLVTHLNFPQGVPGESPEAIPGRSCTTAGSMV